MKFWNRFRSKTAILFLSRKLAALQRGTPRERGQALVITAVAFMAMLAFAGLVTDAGTLYLNFTRLKRGLDSAAVAAANQIRDSSLPAAQRKALIRESAREMLLLNNLDIYSLETYICEDAGIPAAFASVCPSPGETKRKLAWIEATQNSPVYFLGLFGIDTIPITTHSIGEAASLDVVIVIDTSESMASETDIDPADGVSDYTPDYDPTNCNSSNTCQPLRDAKDAAKAMIDKFFDGYDRIAVVTYNVMAAVKDPDPSTPGEVLEADHTAVKNTIDGLQLFDGPAPTDILAFGDPRYGEVNPMNVDGDGDYFESNDILGSTCTGCGIRVAGNILKAQGRVDSVWIIVFLSDGTTNVSDLPPGAHAGSPETLNTDPNYNEVPAGYTDGFCGGAIGARLWTNEPSTSYSWCTDSDPSTRHCAPFHVVATDCPDGATWVGNSTPPYDTEDYAMDMIDRVALVYPLYPSDSAEPKAGDEIAIYAIGLGQAARPPDYDGEQLLRYMANIGDDNFRNPVPDILADPYPADPCDGVAPQTSCGQYYYAPSGAYLTQIFEKVAGSIFTRITQ